MNNDINAMKLNFEQIEIYLQHISLTLPLSDKLQELRADLHTIFISFDRERNLTIIENLFNKFKFELQTHFRRQWSTFNIISYYYWFNDYVNIMYNTYINLF